jgi:hypothetical protein
MINRGDPAFVVEFVHSEDSTEEYWVVERFRNPFCNKEQPYYKEIFRKRQQNIGSFLFTLFCTVQSQERQRRVHSHSTLKLRALIGENGPGLNPLKNARL